MYEELKKLAKACRQDQWLSKTSSEDPDEGAIVYIEIPNASSNAISVLFDADWATDAETDFVAAANPSAVLALIANLEKIDADRKACWAEFKVQGRYIDQLKAENELLRKDTERYRWLKTCGYKRTIYGSSSQSVGHGPCILMTLPSCGAPSSIVLSMGSADSIIDQVMSKESQ